MDKQMYVDILAHQLKGIMFHSDAYSVACLHGYKQLMTAHCKQVRAESECFMYTRCKSIEALDEIVDIPKQTQLVVPHDASPDVIIDIWHKWEAETVAIYAKAVATEPTCKYWLELHKEAVKELECIPKMK